MNIVWCVNIISCFYSFIEVVYFLAAFRHILGHLVVSWQSQAKRPESQCAQPRNNHTLLRKSQIKQTR